MRLRCNLAPLALALICLGPVAPAMAQVVQNGSILILDPELKALRHAMLEGRTVGSNNLRRLADAGDSLAAFNFANRLDHNGGKWTDVVHYYAMALYSGRDFVTRRLVGLVKKHRDDMADLKPARRKSVEDALMAAARRGNRDAALALADFYIRGEPFGDHQKRAISLLKPYAVDGDGAAAFQIALIAIGKTPAEPADPVMARAMLELAVAGDDLANKAMAQNLLSLLPADSEGANP